MILYLLWGLIFAVLYHLTMVSTEQDITFTEIFLIIITWPLIVLIFLWIFIESIIK